MSIIINFFSLPYGDKLFVHCHFPLLWDFVQMHIDMMGSSAEQTQVDWLICMNGKRIALQNGRGRLSLTSAGPQHVGNMPVLGISIMRIYIWIRLPTAAGLSGRWPYLFTQSTGALCWSFTVRGEWKPTEHRRDRSLMTHPGMRIERHLGISDAVAFE